MDVKCSICDGRVLSHSQISKCAIYHNVYHLKCLSLNEIDQNYLLKNKPPGFVPNIWAQSCHSIVLTMTLTHQALNYRDHFELDWSSFCQKVFNPFDTYNQLDKSGFFYETGPETDFTMSFIISMEFYLIIFLSISLTNWNVMQLNLISFLHLVAAAERFLYGCYWDPTPERMVPWGYPQ